MIYKHNIFGYLFNIIINKNIYFYYKAHILHDHIIHHLNLTLLTINKQQIRSLLRQKSLLMVC